MDDFVVGDIVAIPHPEGRLIVKLLRIDRWPDGSECFHLRAYGPVNQRVDVDRLNDLEIFAEHLPVSASSIRADGEKVAHQPVLQEELDGFLRHLKDTDFYRYAEETGQDIDELISLARQAYDRGNKLADLGSFEDALAAYSEAVELFPLFREAIDNRGLTQMDLGQLAEALLDFERSLLVNPDGPTAFISKGECLKKLGNVDEAERVLCEAAVRWPQHLSLIDRVRGGSR